jgi:cation diffusion facilitator CzcD-associated flavoprotein CzcO
VEAHQIPVIDTVIVACAGTAGARATAAFPSARVLASDDVVGATFDDTNDTWLLRTRAGDDVRARVVINAASDNTPSMPNIRGYANFHGRSFHAAEWHETFDANGKRIAVIGERAAHILPALADAKSVTVFHHTPTWQVTQSKSRWRRRAKVPQQVRPVLVTSRIERITSTGIRTVDGADHDADAIVYATGSKDSTEAYLGVAMHGSPNYFTVLGPDSPIGNRAAVISRQLGVICECLNLMRRKASTRVEVRQSAQHQYIERAHIKPAALAFDFSSDAAVEDDIYDGPATLMTADEEREVRVRLTGHLEPIDGKYHWQGMVFGTAQPRAAKLAINGRTTPARITEQTPWSHCSIAGTGTPPFALNDVDVAVPYPT